MTAIKIYKKITIIIYFLGSTLLLCSCAKTTNPNTQNVGVGEEYGSSDYGWR
ncbi:hypothetical protein [Legionella longbeachae]|uniref:hypothetical protein n=1 Tax=Legionella longbeachae TaxID=450 RepID=UPI0001BEC488|nr:hypothetical protein [Legionella longbeachae]EEZ97016.1 putative lipoprotein [Legionella longbeachae D-4968]UAK46976.1 hypothetical protein K8O86_01905 [Legionella longbeachae]HBD7397197.1 hypothetical protein [Legionella pneumophila]